MSLPQTVSCETKYIYHCSACGQITSEVVFTSRGCPMQVPNDIPLDWTMIKRRIHGVEVIDIYCPNHCLMIEDNEVHVYAKDSLGIFLNSVTPGTR